MSGRFAKLRGWIVDRRLARKSDAQLQRELGRRVNTEADCSPVLQEMVDRVMGAEEILNELEGFYAYETGCIDSGVKNDVRRAELLAAFDALPEDEQRIGYARFLRNAYLSEEAIQQGYGPEDAYSFYCWFGWLT